MLSGETAAALLSVPGDTGKILAVDMTPGAEVGICTEAGGAFQVWCLQTCTLLHSFKDVSVWVTRGYGATLSACGRLAMTVTWDRSVQLWCLETLQCVSTLTVDQSLVHIKTQSSWVAGGDTVVAIADDDGGLHFLRYRGRVA